jgi:hypothetical protein
LGPFGAQRAQRILVRATMRSMSSGPNAACCNKL